MKRIPRNGIWGEEALREAAAGSFQHIMRLIETKLREAMKLAGEREVWPHVVALFPDNVVVHVEGGFTRYDYTLNGDADVTLANPVKVVETFKPVEGAVREACQGAFIEAEGEDSGRRWKIRVIRAGLSGNMNFYSDAVLRESVSLFDNVRVFVKADEEHLKGKGKDVRNLIGKLSEARFVEGKAPDRGEIQATFDILESAGPIAAKLTEAWGRGMADLFGFSIDAVGKVRAGKLGRKAVRIAEAFKKVSSVDLIVEPGAGGQVIDLIEARNEDPDMKLRDKMLKLIEAKRPDLFKTLDPDNPDDDAIEAAYREAVQSEAAAENANDDAPAGVSRDEMDTAVREAVDKAVGEENARNARRTAMREAIADSNLPPEAQAKLRKQFDRLESFTEAEVEQAITDEAAYLARFTESGRVVELGEDGQIEMGETRAEKVTNMLDAFFDPDNREVISFKECYREITGDDRITGLARNCDQARLREAISSGTFAEVLGDSITRRMIADYQNATVYDIWRNLTGTPVPIADFRTQERTRWGGYGDLPAVAENAAYQPLASPGDEDATYAVTKRGGTETISLETIKNDDVGVIQRIPVKLSRAAKRTLGKFVLDFIKDNPVIYDGDALFHANHANLGSAALDATTLAAGRLAIKKQTEFGSTDQIGVGPKYLWVPDDLEEAAVDLFRRNTENDKTFVQSLALDIMPVWYWTDANDWALSVDPLDIPTIEIGFLDGQEEPELFVQDNPTQGSLFTNDQILYKIRHIYGGNALDYRGLYKAVVA